MPNGVSTKCYIVIKKDLCYFIEKNHFMNYAYIIRKIQIYETWLIRLYYIIFYFLLKVPGSLL